METSANQCKQNLEEKTKGIYTCATVPLVARKLQEK